MLCQEDTDKRLNEIELVDCVAFAYGVEIGWAARNMEGWQTACPIAWQCPQLPRLPHPASRKIFHKYSRSEMGRNVYRDTARGMDLLGAFQ